MILKNKTILLISPEPWQHLHVSKHHYAIALSKLSNKVFFLNPPSNTKAKINIQKTAYPNLNIIDYKGFLPGMRFFPNFIQKRLIKNKFSHIESYCQTKFEIVWSFDNSVFFNFSALPQSVFCISHIVDYSQDFNFKKTAQTADLCLAISTPILEKFKLYNNNSFIINHGFNPIKKTTETVALPGKNAIKCLYSGNMDIQYIDWELVHKLIHHFKNVDFIFIGTWRNKTNQTAILKNKNCYYMGFLTTPELLMHYESADVLLIFYNQKKFPLQLTNSHKVMEYLSSGKVIVSTWLEDYEKIKILEMTKSQSDFINRMETVVSNIDNYNNVENIEKRKQFALKNTYQKQISRIEEIMLKTEKE